MQARAKLAAAAMAAVVSMGVVTVRAESPNAADRKPLMAALDGIGLATPLEDANIAIFGHVEGSWTISESGPVNNFITGRVFDFENEDLTLNQVDLTVERTVDISTGEFDVGGRMEWIWGGDSRLIHANGLFDHYNDDTSYDEEWDLNQLYVDFAIPAGNGLRVRAGKWVTLLGYETINPTGNALYSHSFLFGYAIPFTHTGVLATYNLTDELSLDAGVTRGWDQAWEDNNDWVDFIARLSYITEVNDRATGMYFSLITGPEIDNDNWRTVGDAIVTYAYADNLTLAVNGDLGFGAQEGADGGDALWGGVAGYASLVLTDNFTLNTRAEWFNDDDGARGFGQDVYEATVGLAIKPLPGDQFGQYFVIRPEVRYDYAEQGLFDGGTDHDQATFGVDAYFAY